MSVNITAAVDTVWYSIQLKATGRLQKHGARPGAARYTVANRETVTVRCVALGTPCATTLVLLCTLAHAAAAARANAALRFTS